MADDRTNNLKFEEVLGEAARRKQTPLSSLDLDERLVNTELWKSEREMYPCWTGTLAVYEALGKAFGEKVEWEGLTVNVPKEFRGKKDVVLLVNHPDFEFHDGVVSSKKFQAVPIPSKDGWYAPDAKFGFPTGNKKERADSRRYLWRRSAQFIGFLSRWYDFDDYYRRNVDAYGRPSYRLGVFWKPVGGKMPKHVHEWKCACGAVKWEAYD